MPKKTHILLPARPKPKPEPEDKAHRPIRRRKRGKIVWPSFTAIPTPVARRCLELELSAPALRLWLALVLASEGHSRTVTMTNTDLMAAARVTESRFHPARKELLDERVLTATPVDSRRREYAYDLEPGKQLPAAKRRTKGRGSNSPWRAFDEAMAHRTSQHWSEEELVDPSPANE